MQYPEPIPHNFTVLSDDYHKQKIHYKRITTKKISIFRLVKFFAWSLSCIALLIILDEPFFMTFCFWASEFLVIFVWTYSFYCEKTFHFDDNDLMVDTKLLCFQWQKIIPKEAITQVALVRYGGKRKYQFMNWGLEIRGKKTIILINRQPFEVNDWLGRVVANWAKLELIDDTARTTKSIW